MGYRISANSFRGNYSFLNLTLCNVTFKHSTYRCGNYSREETIQGRKLFAEIRYMVKCLEIYVRIQSGPAGPVRQIWVSGPVRSGNSFAQSGRALRYRIVIEASKMSFLPEKWL